MTLPNIQTKRAALQNYGSGSYLASDVTVLLDMVDKDAVADVPVNQKEALIQSGQRHYSDMLTLEQAPTAMHEQLYIQALEQGTTRAATDIAHLSHTLHHVFQHSISDEHPLILVSLVRAGLPIGVLLQRALSDTDSSYRLPSVHYGISIIRDRGLDPVALQMLLEAYPNSPMVFVDGWTGKGAIYQELSRSLEAFSNPSHPKFANIFHQGADVIPLLTLADPAGVAWLAASEEDWLIPSGLLNSTVSGLISRSLYTEPQSGLHRSVFYDDLIAVDHSLAFIEHIDAARQSLTTLPKCLPTYQQPRYQTADLIDTLAADYDIVNRNRIKPTIAEATRAILRRDPERILLATAEHPDTILLRHLCAQRNITISVLGDKILPYQAITLIKQRAKDH
ncbi:MULTISPECIES: cysteine protease StiP domain-containing protein [unclassified Psychrobacter]|uniref:cysteine protease StiP domain-containing protein n=1 Tax=unclassified Psychrobacter TaxID=196806 RepID=UPI0025B4B9D0|nr:MULTISPECIES: cysteine protease StiP domain-containing protein [unclassified Psychrobacter]MDN3453723.1 tellurite-like stress resistance cysteine protease StiP [Psychrobacter sp. APC 3350]MDN3502200.1 tellurite-like stress resistance cysteine protease StiP [Psychrobacter sp. 5A.1]